MNLSRAKIWDRLRRICTASGVSTHSVYIRFGDKAGLFDALVKEAADGLLEVYLKSVHALDGCGAFSDIEDVGRSGTQEVLQYIFTSILQPSS